MPDGGGGRGNGSPTVGLGGNDKSSLSRFSERKDPPTSTSTLQSRVAMALNFVQECTPVSPPPATPPSPTPPQGSEDRGDAVEKAEKSPEGTSPPVLVSESDQLAVTEEEEENEGAVSAHASKEELSGEDSSGSSLSDKDWLDEDLLPRRYDAVTRTFEREYVYMHVHVFVHVLLGHVSDWITHKVVMHGPMCGISIKV